MSCEDPRPMLIQSLQDDPVNFKTLAEDELEELLIPQPHWRVRVRLGLRYSEISQVRAPSDERDPLPGRLFCFEK